MNWLLIITMCANPFFGHAIPENNAAAAWSDLPCPAQRRVIYANYFTYSDCLQAEKLRAADDAECIPNLLPDRSNSNLFFVLKAQK